MESSEEIGFDFGGRRRGGRGRNEEMCQEVDRC